MTNERIDHAAEARDMLDGKNHYGSASEALAHATLALVEQQRIANRIAIGVALRDEALLRDGRVSNQLQTWLYNGGGILGYFMEDEKEALGL